MQVDTAEGWMASFPDHPVFSSGSPSNGKERMLESSSSSKLIAVKINQNDLVVAYGNELRLTSMAKYKSAASSHNPNEPQGSYKVLKPSVSMSFPKGPITQLVPNPTSQLLAICSDFDICVIALPRLDEHIDTSFYLDCETLSVGESSLVGDEMTSMAFSKMRVVKVLWHGLSYRAGTLLALYSNGMVHEYDITRDSKRPTQILDFNSPLGILPHHTIDQNTGEMTETHEGLVARMLGTADSPSISSRTRGESSGPQNLARNRREGTFSAEDVSATNAVSMCFGTGIGDWGPMTLYGLMENGDLPSFFILSEVLQIRQDDGVVSCEVAVHIFCLACGNSLLPITYKSSLLFFLTTKLEALSKSSPRAEESQDIRILQKSLYYSLDFLNAIEKLSQSQPNGASSNLRSKDELIDLYGMLKARPLRQGPFLMQPSPIELDPETSSGTGQSEFDPSASSVGVFMIAYQNRVDVHIEVDKVEPYWQSLPINKMTYETEVILPALITHETIDLQLPGDVQSAPNPFGPVVSHETSGGVRFVKDTRHPDVVFLWHRFGVQAISMFRWIDPLTRLFQEYTTTGSIRSSDIQHTIGGLGGADVRWVIKTAPSDQPSTESISAPLGVQCLAVIDDAYLGYALLSIFDDLQVLLHPLRHRPVSSLPLRLPLAGSGSATPETGGASSYPFAGKKPVAAPPRINAGQSDRRFYTSLLAKPWIPSRLLNGQPMPSSLSKIKIPQDLNSTDSKSFRFIVEVNNELDRQIRGVIEAANETQDRLKLQIREYERQLSRTFSAQETLARFADQSPLSTGTEARITRITDFQKKLLERSDDILQRLTDRVNPTLSEGERRWFSELRRMKTEVGCEEKTGSRSGLFAEVEKMKADLQSINQAVKKLPEHLQLEWTRGTTQGKLGDKQIQDIQHRLVQGTTCLEWVQIQIQELNDTLAHLKSPT
ncbi:uncharacterized protein MELLADRAFT_95061 [Melampsora larici-populina 98AG31]|uniref:Uncharacterized protein n=1 Tax=Melampsora larici-populina (strain 98AG31 / pathotype 3-4-7) TaxID=747676 RepID=F4S8Z2_MELLP|nr:uncharacterized protein MELLADRAFT_95061 [Melampsora larici-populina 98AG31]EGF98907.1 hypothetical protein MELLADRAFT_95061 [Melampsora larici-populina 98AG31]